MVNNMSTAQRPAPFNSASPGMIANIAPEFHFVNPGRFLDEPNWGGAVIMIPWNLYQVYGDTKVMAANYSTMVKWLNWEATTKAANGGNIGGLGDWSAAQSTDAQPIIDYGYYRGANTMAKIAQLLGNTADAATYSALATSLATEYNTKYLHTDASGNAWYANNTEASNAAALDAGLVPAQYHQAVVNSLVAAVAAYGYRIGTGSVGLGPLFRVLHAEGRDDVIYQMVINPASPGYAFLVNSGFTTLGESLSGGSSHDHQFLGQVASWFVHDLAGIGQTSDSLGYRHLLIRPALVGDLASANATYTTPAGDAASQWTRTAGGTFSLDVTIPVNTPTEVWVPAYPKYAVVAPAGASFLRNDAVGPVSYAVYSVGAGSYHFASVATTTTTVAADYDPDPVRQAGDLHRDRGIRRRRRRHPDRHGPVRARRRAVWRPDDARRGRHGDGLDLHDRHRHPHGGRRLQRRRPAFRRHQPGHQPHRQEAPRDDHRGHQCRPGRLQRPLVPHRDGQPRERQPAPSPPPAACS